ncbi:MAG: hypothetical protein RL020_442 [Pseudomonadota bacterium]|jgi:hypothetical protein
MKIFSLGLLIAAGFLVQGCAQLPADNSTAQADYDVGKVAAIERYALRNNVHVIWINYPPARK